MFRVYNFSLFDEKAKSKRKEMKIIYVMVLLILMFVEQAYCRIIKSMNFIWTGLVACITVLRNAYKFIETLKREPICDMTAFA
jgi:hypothetical protein